MFFEKISQIQEIASKTGCSIFVVPDPSKIEIKNSIILEPEKDKNTISIEQTREIIATLSVKQKTDRFIVINPAETLGESAANALLKNLEEPKNNYHFVLIVSDPSRLLSTILSRSEIYFLKTSNSIDGDLDADEKTKEIAKRLIIATPKDLILIAEEITKKKDNTRGYALKILSTTIDMLYKSYFKTKNAAFIKKLPKFISAYENIEKNGHIKLHLVADLM